MCGRYALYTPEEQLALRFEFSSTRLPAAMPPRYNVAPTDQVLTVGLRDGRREGQMMRWGLVPAFSKGPKSGPPMINARADTIGERPAFRDAFARHRCLVLADGFYEWRRSPDGTKTPIWLHLANGEPFAFAGLWAAWKPQDGDEWTRSCTIVTTDPNELMVPIHDRMPVILQRDAEQAWLENDDVEALRGLLVPYPSELMVATSVSSLVNNVRNDLPECLEPVA